MNANHLRRKEDLNITDEGEPGIPALPGPSFQRSIVGGDTEVSIMSNNLVLSHIPFDSGSTCRMLRGELKINQRKEDVACKQFLFKITLKFKRRMEKEVKCILKLQHPNVLCHFGIDFSRSILVTEYLEKRIKLDDQSVEIVHNARQLLDTLEVNLPWHDRVDIVRQACHGLAYLHDNNIVHCDIKSGNIIIGGTGETTPSREYIAKIGDFGQAFFDYAQFSLSQTTSRNVPETSKENDRMRVGTAPYTAPEIMEIGARRNYTSDIYSFAMVMAEFSVPERSHPWEGEIDSCDLIFHHVKLGKRPNIVISNPDSNLNQKSWLSLMKSCWNQNTTDRPSMSQIQDDFRSIYTLEAEDNDTKTNSFDVHDFSGLKIENICLDIHQSVVTENASAVAASVFENDGKFNSLPLDIEQCISELDGTNACTFFSLKNLDSIYTTPSKIAYNEELKWDIENTLRDLPSKINDVRDKTMLYNVEEAINILQSKHLLTYKYELKELIKDQLCTDPDGKKENMREAILTLTKNELSMSIYTSTPVCLVIGYVKGVFIIIDTHCIPTHLDGNGNALIKLVHCEPTNESLMAGAEVVLKWIIRRMDMANGTYNRAESLLHIAIIGEANSKTVPETTWLSDEDDNSFLTELQFVGNHDAIPMNKRAESIIDDRLCPWNSPSPDDKLDESVELLWRGHLTKFGMSSLKPFQLDAIRALERQNDVIVIQKTGSGKSLCYQLPSLFDKKKTSVVICPTISLINSQLENLAQQNIKAVAAGPQYKLCGSIFDQDELPPLIYTTPEYFDKKLKFQLDPGKLKVIVIDEVHKVFDRQAEFRSSYDTLKYLHEEFENIPIMALTATLTEEQLQSLCNTYLNNPTLIRDTVNRPNIKLNVGKYNAKRPSKGDKSVVWMDAARDIKQLVGNEYAIVYMDFKRDVELMVTCLSDVGVSDVKAFHGGLGATEKNKIDSAFRNKEFQILIATESYEVGTHSPHVHNVLRMGCMRNVGVIIQEFGRAGRGGEQSDGYLFFNEHKDDQRLTYWTLDCNDNDVQKITKQYEESWRSLYGVYNGTCLRKALLKSYENESLIQPVNPTECCTSCDLQGDSNFNAKDTASLLLKAIKEVQEIDKSKEGVKEDKITSWLLGAKRDWISDPRNQESIDKSTTFGKGCVHQGKPLNTNWWSRHLRQLISLNLVEILFETIRTNTFSNTVRRYTVSVKGNTFLQTISELFVMSPFKDPFSSITGRKTTRRESDKGGRGIHHLPKIRNGMSSDKNWFEITKREEYEFPGFSEHSEHIGYCENIKDMTGFGSHKRQHFMWEDNQLTKRHTTNRVYKMFINGKNTEVHLRRSPCEGVKVCDYEDCTYTVSNRQKINKCQEHGETHKLKASGVCPVHLIYIWPINDDGRRWIGIVPGQEHNHLRPAPHIISQEVKTKISTAVKKDSSLTTKDLQKGYGVGAVPGELSPAAVNPERIRRERKSALSCSMGSNKHFLPLLKIMDFQIIREKVEKQQDSESELTKTVNGMMGQYQMDGIEYCFKPGRKHAFFMSPYQTKLLAEADELFSDITYTENEHFPYLLNFVVFNPTTLHYQAVVRVLCDRQDGISYGSSFHEVFDKVTEFYPGFKRGTSLKQILVDFDDAEYNGFVDVLGKDIVEMVVRGCSVHWMRSVNRVAKMVCTTQDEEVIFKTLGKKVESVEEKEQVMDIFQILSGKKDVKHATLYLPANLGQTCKESDISNNGWKKLKHWADWWTSTRHLQMMTKAYAIRESDDWDDTSNTTNPVESINRQSFKSKANLHAILENMYMEDRLHAVKMAARSRDINISYSSSKPSRKRKRSSLVNSPNENENGPPDKLRHVRATNKPRKRGRALINSAVEVEYQEKEDDNLVYLGWLSGTISAYNKSKGYLVQFKDQKDSTGKNTGDWTDWIPSVDSNDVRFK